MKKIYCCICNKKIDVMQGNNPYPVRNYSVIGTSINRCCSECNDKYVVPSRIYMMRKHYKEKQAEEFSNKLKKLKVFELNKMFGY